MWIKTLWTVLQTFISQILETADQPNWALWINFLFALTSLTASITHTEHIPRPFGVQKPTHPYRFVMERGASVNVEDGVPSLF